MALVRIVNNQFLTKAAVRIKLKRKRKEKITQVKRISKFTL